MGYIIHDFHYRTVGRKGLFSTYKERLVLMKLRITYITADHSKIYHLLSKLLLTLGP